MQALADGDVFVGWGSEPYFSEFSAGGQLLYDAHMHGSYQSYRAYRFPWTGTPARPARDRGERGQPSGPVTVYASWNGATEVASWRVLAGPSPDAARAGGERRQERLRDGDRHARPRALRRRAGARTPPERCSGTSPTIKG